MTGFRFFSGMMTAIIVTFAAVSPSISDDTVEAPPFQAYVDMKTFMEHVLSPAAAIIWKVNGMVIDAKGEHDLSPNRTTTGSRS